MFFTILIIGNAFLLSITALDKYIECQDIFYLLVSITGFLIIIIVSICAYIDKCKKEILEKIEKKLNEKDK